jgi:hypothetical protein
MTVRFKLTMRDAWIGNELVDFLELQWHESLSPRQLASRFNAWLSDQTFISRQMPDLRGASYCQLFIDPLK